MKRTFALIDTSVKTSKSPCQPIEDYFVDLGFTKTDPLEADVVISINHNRKVMRHIERKSGRMPLCFLIRLEPRVVYPAQYIPRVESLYQEIFTPGSIHGDIPWPYEYHPNPSSPVETRADLSSLTMRDSLNRFESWATRKNKFVMIAANKVSPLPNTNYDLRRDVASTADSEFLDIFGGLWGASIFQRFFHRAKVARWAIITGVTPSPRSIYANFFKRYPTSHGPTFDKHLTAERYKFALVIENDYNYMSEKLIDALIDGCIPVYAGPPIASMGLPADLAIPFTSPYQLREILDSFPEEDARKHFDLLESFLESGAFAERWRSDLVFRDIAKRINSYVGENR